MIEKIALAMVVLLSDLLGLLLLVDYGRHKQVSLELTGASSCRAAANWPSAKLDPLEPSPGCDEASFSRERIGQAPRGAFMLFAEAKGVAGLGKAGGDGQGGSDKAGQQVPPEVYNALTWAGTAFLFTLSVPLILYGLNKLFNKIEDCFGCGSARRKRKKQQAMEQLHKQHAIERPGSQQQQPLKQAQGKQHLSNSDYKHHQNSNANNVASPSQQQLLASPPNSTAITLPFDFELKYEGVSQQNYQQQQQQHQQMHHHQQQQQQQQQPYIISSPHL